VGERAGIPVYLYEEAASRPERKNWKTCASGQYESLKDEILPTRTGLLISVQGDSTGRRDRDWRTIPADCFQCVPEQRDVDIAKKVAKAIRHSSAGCGMSRPGLLVDGMAQSR